MFTLERIESIVNEDIPRQLNKTSITSDRFIKQVMSDKGPRLESMHHEFYNSLKKLSNEEAVQMTIRTCQYSVVSMLDKLFDLLPEEEVGRMAVMDPGEGWTYLYKHLHKMLYSFYGDLYLDFYRYMDHRYAIPAYDQYLLEAAIIKGIKKIKGSIGFLALNKELREIILQPLEISLSTSDPGFFTRVWMTFIENLMSRFLFYADHGEGDEWHVHKLLLYINFNSPGYIDYLTTMFKKVFDKISDNRIRYMQVLETRKHIAQQIVSEGLAFNHAQPTLKSQLDEWFKWEIYYLKRLMQLETTA